MGSKQARNKIGEYSLNQVFKNGYRACEDPTVLTPDVLVSPSQNVMVGTSGRIGSVSGYTLDGDSSTAIDSGILSCYDFDNFKGNRRNMRAGFLTSAANDGKLQFRYEASDGTISWKDLKTGLTNVRLSFCDFWDTTNLLKDVLWVDGSDNIFSWNGAVTTFSSASNSSGYVQAINATPTSGGTGYLVGDVLTISGGAATATVTAVTGATTGSITSIQIGVPGGSGYLVGDVLTIPGGSGTATVTVTSVTSSGSVSAITITTTGTGYSSGVYVNPTGGSGTGTGNWLIATIGGQAISSLSLTSTGSGYTTGAGKATTGGTGTGATVEITTVAQGAIVKEGTTTFAEEGFYQSSNLSINVGGIDYTYTQAVGNTIVGVTPNPTTPNFAVGTVMFQTPVTVALSAMTSISSTFAPTVIGCGRRNQVYVGSSNSNNLYISKVNSYTDYSYTSPTRVVGEGALIQLDASPTVFIPLEVVATSGGPSAYDMYISEGLNNWSIIRATLSSDLTKETLEHIRMRVAPLQGATGLRLSGKMQNHIMFVGHDNVAYFFGYNSYENVPSTTDFSHPIINDMSGYDFTDGQIFHYRNYIYIAIPKHGIMRVYNMTDQSQQQNSNYKGIEDVTGQPWFWEAPITYPISGFYVVDGELYGHGYNASESYKLFSGGSLNGQDITANATFAYDAHGDRTQSKASDELFLEGYISQNTTITATVSGDLDAFATSQTVSIVGNDSQYVAFGSGAHSLGKSSLGSQPLGGAQTNTSTLPAWFHVIKTYAQIPSYLEQVSLQTKGVDLSWQLIAYGTNAKFTTEGNNAITD